MILKFVECAVCAACRLLGWTKVLRARLEGCVKRPGIATRARAFVDLAVARLKGNPEHVLNCNELLRGRSKLGVKDQVVY